MGDKNVSENAGNRILSESGIYAELFCNGRNKNTGSSEDLPFPGTDLQRIAYGKSGASKKASVNRKI